MKVNSERVKGKNFKVLAGKPLFKWILESLLQVPEIDEIIIKIINIKIGIYISLLIIKFKKLKLSASFINLLIPAPMEFQTKKCGKNPIKVAKK